ncbi:uncharacterized protein LODBEIA_P55290 [Lodderomyces beijingensis]|uniref:HMA domain-containing protein n=1 Tax=Lodderomyces beijingensis TaxID=1775926 RepID=A0ABP0ZT47_9ASCO
MSFGGGGTSISDSGEGGDTQSATFQLSNLHTENDRRLVQQRLASVNPSIVLHFVHQELTTTIPTAAAAAAASGSGQGTPALLNELAILDNLADLGFKAVMTSSSVPQVQTRVNIQGMTCGACSASITECLEKQPGISRASISAVTENGLIRHSENFPREKIVELIEDCGFDAQIQVTNSQLSSSSSSSSRSPSRVSSPNTSPMKQTTIGISGMTCGACSSSITAALEDLDGVEYVSVSLITEEASIRHPAASISPDQLKQVIEDCGFTATHVRSTDLSKQPRESQPEAEEIALKLVGVHSTTDLLGLRYNVEALLHSIPGVRSFHFTLQGTDANSVETPAQTREILTSDDTAANMQNLVNELIFAYDPIIVGIRDVVDALNKVDEDVEFFVINSLDQSSASQLRLLSKVKDIQYWKSIFIQSLVLGIPIIVLVHTEHMQIWKRDTMIFPGLYLVTLIELVLSTYVQFHLGANYIRKFSSFLRKGFRGASMDVLVCISTMVTYIFSVTSLVVSVWYGRTEKPPKVLFDTLVMLLTFVSFGKLLENKAKGATSTALSGLLQLTPSTCTIIQNTAKYDSNIDDEKKISSDHYQTRCISIDLVQPNDIAIVLPGGKIPADGVVVFGETEVNESFITGEPLPIYKSKGDSVIGGTINGPHLIHIKVTNTGNKSQLQQIINLVKDSQVNKAPVQRFSDVIAARFVPSVMLLAAITFVIWLIICYSVHPDGLPKIFKKDENGKFFVCLQLAISVIVVACPCALGLAAPTAIMVGTGVGATNGVLIKGADILEKTTSINVLLFDKTGTLTTGEMSLVKANPILKDSKITATDWWRLVGSVECNSEHPIGRALTKSARVKAGLTFEGDTFDSTVESINILIGSGIEADVKLGSQKYNVHVGNAKLIKEKFPDLLAEIDEIPTKTQNTVTFVVIDGHYCGSIELSDSLKEGSREVIEYLRNVEGYTIGMVTGDNRGAALRIGKEVGIAEENIFYEVSPVHKDKVITGIKNRLGSGAAGAGAGADASDNVGVAFIGDGINDAPALAKADIGMAISSGTDIAIESADIVLIGNRKANQTDLHSVVNALKISNVTFSRIKLNFVWAIVYNLFMLPFAMGCFLPLNLMLPPVAASIAMMCSSLSVVFSSLLLKCWKPPKIGGKAVSNLDLERGEEDIQDFDLRNGTREEFDAHKRQKSLTFSSVLRKLTRRNFRNSTTASPSYELVLGSL